MRMIFVLGSLLLSVVARADFYGSCDDPDNNYCTEFIGPIYADQNQKVEYCALGSGNGKLTNEHCAPDLKPGCRFNGKQENENVLYGYGNVREVLQTICTRIGGELQE